MTSFLSQPQSGRFVFRSARTFAVATLLFFTMNSHPANAASAEPFQSVVFQEGVGGYASYRIPALVTAANGDVLAFAEGRVAGTSDTGDIDLVLRGAFAYRECLRCGRSAGFGSSEMTRCLGAGFGIPSVLLGGVWTGDFTVPFQTER